MSFFAFVCEKMRFLQQQGIRVPKDTFLVRKCNFSLIIMENTQFSQVYVVVFWGAGGEVVGQNAASFTYVLNMSQTKYVGREHVRFHS